MTIKDTILNALGYARSDSLERCIAIFRKCTPAEMKEVWQDSGKTRQEILDTYQQERDELDTAIEWVKRHCHDSN